MLHGSKTDNIILVCSLIALFNKVTNYLVTAGYKYGAFGNNDITLILFVSILDYIGSSKVFIVLIIPCKKPV